MKNKKYRYDPIVEYIHNITAKKEPTILLKEGRMAVLGMYGMFAIVMLFATAMVYPKLGEGLSFLMMYICIIQ